MDIKQVRALLVYDRWSWVAGQVGFNDNFASWVEDTNAVGKYKITVPLEEIRGIKERA